MSASEIRLAVSYSIQKETYIFPSYDIHTRILGYHNPYSILHIMNIQPASSRLTVSFPLPPVAHPIFPETHYDSLLSSSHDYCFPFPGAWSWCLISHLEHDRSLTGHRSSSFIFLCSIGNPSAVRLILAWLPSRDF